MSGIVCGVRGGPESETTVAAAIALAKETGLSLHFLYVVNLDFMTYTSSTRVHTISEEMHEMGEFILLSAQSRAAGEGVSAEIVVRHGNVGQEIVALCHELEAGYLVVGRPRIQPAQSVFTQEMIAAFVLETQRSTGAKVILADGGEV